MNEQMMARTALTRKPTPGASMVDVAGLWRLHDEWEATADLHRLDTEYGRAYEVQRCADELRALLPSR
jgi:hypothetical protein